MMSSRKPTEWRLLIAVLLPWLGLSAVAFVHWLDLETAAVHQQQRSELVEQLRTAFSSAGSTRSRTAVERALSNVIFSEAWIEDEERARIWHRGKPQAKTAIWQKFAAGPDSVRVHWPLGSKLTLVAVAPRLSEPQRKQWQQLIASLLLGLFVFIVLIVWLSYQLSIRPWHRLWRWAQLLEQGQLDQRFDSAGIGGAIAVTLNSLARRLKYARQALSELQQNETRRTGQRPPQADDEKQHGQGDPEKLATNISHELRTPLTGIVGFADLLQKTELDEQQREFVDAIRRSSSDMVEFIGDFLDKESAKAGQLELRSEAFDVADIVEDTAAMLAPMAYQKNLGLFSIIDHDVPHPIEGDHKRVAQILKNLVSNAIKYTNQGHVLIRVEHRVADQGQIQLQISVEDTGRGLSEEQQKQLFQAFQRFDSEQFQPTEGTGLGLQITQQLTQLLGGHIEVDSEPGQGSQFRVTLPFNTLPASHSKLAWRALEKRKAWLLEEDPVANRALAHLLHYWGLELETKDSLASLKRSLKELGDSAHPELIIIGHSKQELKIEPVTHVINIASSRDVPVISLVNSVESQDLKRLERLGSARVLSKSTSRSALYRAMTQVLTDEQTPARPLEGRQVLLAENNPASQQYLTTLLSQLGARVSAADDGEAALLLWRRNQPDFLLLDYNMPKADGREVALQVSRSERPNETVIIGSSAYLTPAQQREWFEAGLDALLMKPFDQQQLLRCLQPWLNAPIADADEPAQGNAARLTEDPELLALMSEELPKQMTELDEAYIAGDWEAARAAAHQLHGTAAFFQLEPLKTHVFLLETRLNQGDEHQLSNATRDDMAKVADAVQLILKGLAAKRL